MLIQHGPYAGDPADDDPFNPREDDNFGGKWSASTGAITLGTITIT